ncbi:aminotransferase class I/II-fold pyridoxal phosphate-dependent enzyme [Erysipelothrix rhusiopathiae]|uniref:DegT/DnrJ/EryC1/StrS aminotransferase family protein n=4 Tax=Erysipelothrix rhusiopathiae TaxID=1648 RepID=E7FXB2_ERYRH|nr:aminotransferase class I/II-fold pyridoxal phosphate-dependent enzyme [Erysipelothrix rhusiopathiae]EFY08819.1 DegT/DnrJ/EryC1/StrS aminotransferase family protein [Erysipelothrix rhusiopathiae ATCC 19414]MCG4437294.1 aminotransferase class I/II-fold pyridoxal phosphate-dependent enzyme [Erysipelothrix rhusiopathiae]MDE8071941.1 aminotransferase class I/II-fold pyridoxal phosphate-dependent enzyme [Erysipelothrix rhusiopathiae]MDE8119047.1 aminotransferase class I/II-fold pyridoxal phosphate
MSKRILLASPHMSEEGFEQEYINKAFESNWIAPLGPNVDGFEQDIRDYTKSTEALALSSGTAAIHLALKLSNIKPGDNVFCQSLTFAATANPIMYEKANPIFIDSEYLTWNMSPEALERAFEKYPGTKVVIVVHLYGINARMDEIRQICDDNNAILIEDAAESLGSSYKDKASGTIGDFGIFSFNGNKIITTSGGGMLVSSNKDMIDKARFWATQAREQARHYQHNEVGYNYRLSNVLAGIGRGQMRVLDQRVARKKEIFKKYKESLGHLDGITFMPENEWSENNYWLSSMIVKNSHITALDVIVALENENIESRPVWKPMHLQPVFSEYDFISVDNHDVSKDLFEHGVCLPSDTKMTDEELERVIKIIHNVFQ